MTGIDIGDGTRFVYAGSETSLVALFVRPEGVLLTTTWFHADGTTDSCKVGLAWSQFTEMARDVAQIAHDNTVSAGNERSRVV
jgi:hypothetical protein